MAFQFSWPTFSQGFYKDARQTLESALNKGTKPAIIADRILVKELDMGTLPPDLEILEIGDLTKDRFRGIFRMTYTGDAYIELQTSIQANPLSQSKPALDILASQAVFAAAPLIVPMRLKLSDLKLKAIIVLVVSRQKGITLVFKNDPLESVTVSSSFDSVSVIQGFIQRSIEGQLREMFRTDLPGLIHKLSQRWLSETSSSNATGAHKPFTGGFSPGARVETKTPYNASDSVVSETLTYTPKPVKLSPTKKPRPEPMPMTPSEMADLSVADSIEAYDPTYGMRPEGIPNQPASFKDFEKLLETREKGIGGLMPGFKLAEDDDADNDWSQLSSTEIRPQDSASAVGQPVEWEHTPAVGGGFISRPRILHAQSQITVPDSPDQYSSTSLYTPSAGRPSLSRAPSVARSQQHHDVEVRPSDSRQRSESLYARRNASPLPSVERRSSWQSGVQEAPPPYSKTLYRRATSSRASEQPIEQEKILPRSFSAHAVSSTILNRTSSLTPSSATSPLSRTSSTFFDNTPSTSYTSLGSARSASFKSLSPLAETRQSSEEPGPSTLADVETSHLPLLDPAELSYTSQGSLLDEDNATPGITVRSNKNDSCAHIATLADTFQTLSPFTRPLANFTARSVPPSMRRSFTTGTDLDKVVKAKRKRLHRIGSAARPTTQPEHEHENAHRRSPSFGSSDSGHSLVSMSLSDYFPHVTSLQRPWRLERGSSAVGVGVRSRTASALHTTRH